MKALIYFSDKRFKNKTYIKFKPEWLQKFDDRYEITKPIKGTQEAELIRIPKRQVCDFVDVEDLDHFLPKQKKETINPITNF